MKPPEPSEKVIIIGAGPAGCSCAVWLALQGISSIVIERAAAPMSTLTGLELQQNWVLGHPNTSTTELAKNYLQHVQLFKEIEIYCGQTALVFQKISPRHIQIQLTNKTLVEGSALVFATGLRPRRPAPYFISTASPNPMDAKQLTRQRQGISNKRVLLLGGGDNAVENAIFLAQKGNSVVLWARTRLCAQPGLQARIQQTERIETRVGVGLPFKLSCVTDNQWALESTHFGFEYFDHVAVLFGFEPEDSAWRSMLDSEGWRRQGWPATPLSDHNTFNAHGIFLAGDISQRMHPCIQTALADGVTTSKQVNQWLCHQQRQPTP